MLSSMRRKYLILVEKLDTKPTTTPRIMDAQGGMKPDAGVAATRPEMQPEHWKVVSDKHICKVGHATCLPSLPSTIFLTSDSQVNTK